MDEELPKAKPAEEPKPKKKKKKKEEDDFEFVEEELVGFRIQTYT